MATLCRVFGQWMALGVVFLGCLVMGWAGGRLAAHPKGPPDPLADGIVRDGQRVPALDFSGINLLCRAAMEAFLTFDFVFCQPKSGGERELRLLLWRVSRLKERQEYPLSVPGPENLERGEDRV